MNSSGNKVQLNILIACEESQAECSAFRELGHNAFSCDIQPCKKKGNPDWHILGDVTPLLGGLTKFTTQSGCTVEVSRWDLIIAHPPCTYLCKMGSVHMRHEPDMIYEIGGKEESLNSNRFIIFYIHRIKVKNYGKNYINQYSYGAIHTRQNLKNH